MLVLTLFDLPRTLRRNAPHLYRRGVHACQRASWRTQRVAAAQARRLHGSAPKRKPLSMLQWAMGYSVAALITGAIGIGGIVLGVPNTKLLCFILIVAVTTWCAAVLCTLIHVLDGGAD